LSEESADTFFTSDFMADFAVLFLSSFLFEVLILLIADFIFAKVYSLRFQML